MASSPPCPSLVLSCAHDHREALQPISEVSAHLPRLQRLGHHPQHSREPTAHTAAQPGRHPQLPSGPTTCQVCTGSGPRWRPQSKSPSLLSPNTLLQNLQESTHLCSSEKKSSAPQLEGLEWGPSCRPRQAVESCPDTWDNPCSREVACPHLSTLSPH